MQRIFAAIRQVFYQGILILGLVSLVSLSDLLIFYNQPGYAATTSSRGTPEEQFERAKSSESPEAREEAYETATKETSQTSQQEAYKENLRGYEKEE